LVSRLLLSLHASAQVPFIFLFCIVTVSVRDWVAMLTARGLGLMTSKGLFQHKAFYDPVILCLN